MCDSILDVVENIIGPNITGVHSMLINKPPNTRPDISMHPMHQVSIQGVEILPIPRLERS